MRPIGTVLMGFGMFFLSVAAAAVLGPALRGMGIDITAETTSVIGTALIGAFAFTTGTLLRRRGTDAAAERRAVDSAAAPAQLGAPPARPIDVPERERRDVR
jgi:hypothetical protein